MTKNHGCSCLITADDLRQQHETSPLLGLAVILPTEKGQYGIQRCYLVSIDTLIHKSQHFVERDSILVTNGGYNTNSFKSCVLVSDSEAIVLTKDHAIIVSLNEQS